jgi:5-methylcytosine-specific restriction endonuclease McrBC regulatory subunit McrC
MGDNKIGVFDVKYKKFRLDGKKRCKKIEDRFQLITYLASYSSNYEVG